jgi:hypothetical protein
MKGFRVAGVSVPITLDEKGAEILAENCQRLAEAERCKPMVLAAFLAGTIAQRQRSKDAAEAIWERFLLWVEIYLVD